MNFTSLWKPTNNCWLHIVNLSCHSAASTLHHTEQLQRPQRVRTQTQNSKMGLKIQTVTISWRHVNAVYILMFLIIYLFLKHYSLMLQWVIFSNSSIFHIIECFVSNPWLSSLAHAVKGESNWSLPTLSKFVHVSSMPTHNSLRDIIIVTTITSFKHRIHWTSHAHHKTTCVLTLAGVCSISYAQTTN